jgi:hypothetical protein
MPGGHRGRNQTIQRIRIAPVNQGVIRHRHEQHSLADQYESQRREFVLAVPEIDQDLPIQDKKPPSFKAFSILYCEFLHRQMGYWKVTMECRIPTLQACEVSSRPLGTFGWP